ncbi:MAG: hypothetical protein U0804_00040 [Gemmataceae bacterium]
MTDVIAGCWRDWDAMSADKPHHWEFSNRKVTDPKWRGRPGSGSRSGRTGRTTSWSC